MRGGFGNITVDIKNIGSEVIRILVVNITIKGGILNKINVYHNETTCVTCNEALDPNDIKTFTTTEEEFIFGLGPIIIDIYANASNAPEIEEKFSGFVIGPFVIV